MYFLCGLGIYSPPHALLGRSSNPHSAARTTRWRDDVIANNKIGRFFAESCRRYTQHDFSRYNCSTNKYEGTTDPEGGAI